MSIDRNTEVDEIVDAEDENLEIVMADDVKVALDTDDAPFLEEEPEPEPEPDILDGKPKDPLALDEEKSGWTKKKKIIVFGSGGGLLLLIIAAAAWWFLFRDPVATIVEEVAPVAEIIVVPDIKEELLPQDFYVNLEPFLIELKNELGEPVFLVFKFSAVTKDQRLASEADNKTLILRDAVYYYLINKTHEYLVNPANVDIIKNDISSVLSGYLAGGKIEGVYFESYLTK